jgi:hypothetical protein
MPVLGRILKKSIEIRHQLRFHAASAEEQQEKVLTKLLKEAKYTKFGQKYNFSAILDSNNIVEEFQKRVPLYDYNSIYKEWWHESLDGKPDICWPGHVDYFALSSGTSESSSKYIPVTKDMLKAIKKTSSKQILVLAKYDLPPEFYTKGILMLGGSTSLKKQKNYSYGDLSGITTGNIPLWFQKFYKPGPKISSINNWNEKLDEITLKAKDWDIGAIVGVPAWLQMLMEKIIAHHKVNNIHDIWPNLHVFVHGGVSFEPYKKGFEQLLSRPLKYIETYLASEGFIAYQTRPEAKGMQIVSDNGIFFEFVPFNSDNFDEDGNLIAGHKICTLAEVEENKDYAILLSTCSGAWRYLIGDVVRFTDLHERELIIVGRTKLYLSLCGEHLSMDNMNKAIENVSQELNIKIKEFTVQGIKYESLFAHKWYIGTDDAVDTELLKTKIDEQLKVLNDDYATERTAALKEVIVEVHPSKAFIGWLEKQGRVGASNKFPRVMKGLRAADWEEFLKQYKQECQPS